MSRYYIVMRVTPWDSFQPTFPMPLLGGVRGPDGSAGFLAVFDDRVAAEVWAEGSPVSVAEALAPSPAGETVAEQQGVTT